MVKRKLDIRIPYKTLGVTRIGNGVSTYEGVFSNGMGIVIVISYQRFPLIAHTVGENYH